MTSSLLITNVSPLPQVTIAGASVGSSYALAGAFSGGVISLTFVSTMDQPVQVSFDGVKDNLVVPIGNSEPAVIPFEFVANRGIFQNPRIYVKEIGTGPSLGALYVSAFITTY